MGIFSTGMIAKVGIELGLGIGIKLFCDNGRVHPADFANDFLFFLPGMSHEDDDGLSRQVNATAAAVQNVGVAPVTRYAK